ncbi:MAG: DNA polymerase III subunit alpha [Deltaproteobacteria bacterium]
MPAEFVHLHVHTQYSFLVSTVKLGELAPRVKELGMRAVAVTDHQNMFAAIRHYKYCKAQGIQAILGSELNIARAGDSRKVDHLGLLATNLEGYKNLIQLVSAGYMLPASEDAPSIDLDTLARHSRGLVGLSGCMNGVVPQRVMEQGPEQAKPLLAQLRDIFEPGHFFVELQDHGLPEQPVVNSILRQAASELELPLVATNNVEFIRPDDGEAQFYLECVRRNWQYKEAREEHHGSFEMYLKSPAEMEQVFRTLPSALSNTVRVAEMCAGLKLTLGQPRLPEFPVPEGLDPAAYFRQVAREGLMARYAQFERAGKNVDRVRYDARLELELDVIARMDYAGYFLIVWDFVREAKARGIPVGPGRGSGAGSLVAYALGITEIDPLPFNLLFERFLNPERVSMPDFDIDFCMSRRDEVIQYVAEKYGRESVGQIATFQNLKARSVIKDVGRTMGMPAPDAQRMASLIPDKGQGKTCTILEALEAEPKLKKLYDEDPNMHELLVQGQKLEGLTRHAGMHAAGVVISDGPLYHHVPVFVGEGTLVTQYDKDDVELAGLIKFDFLGLKTLTVIEVARKLVNLRPDRQQEPLDFAHVPIDDRPTYQLISSGDTTGVFQLESSGMQQLLRGLKPDCFEDIIAAVALYRPGPLGTGMIDDFIGGKHKRKAIRKLHPLIDAVLEPTYGVPVYQEQVMQMAQLLAGYSLGGADVLRRVMGKKKLEEMSEQRSIFVAGAREKGVSEEQALSIFNEIEGFASYGFNKSHSAAYALVTYQTAYLKAHYPVEFFAAMLTADKDKIEKVVRMIAEARAWGVSVLPPDINASYLDFTVVYRHPDGRGPGRGPGRLRDRHGPQIRFGLGAVRGLGSSALDAVFETRDRDGEFKDMFDFASRVDPKRVNKGVLEALVQCGAFDISLLRMGIDRARAFAGIDRALERGRSASRDRASGQTSLFGLFNGAAGAAASNGAATHDYPEAEGWDRAELLKREKQALGCYVSGHPLDRYGDKPTRIGAIATTDLSSREAWSLASLAGVVEGYQEKIFRAGMGGGKGSGGKAAFFELEDMRGRVRAKVRGDRVDTYSPLLTSGEPVLVSGKISFPMTDEGTDEQQEATLLVDEVVPLLDALRKATTALCIPLKSQEMQPARLRQLVTLLEQMPGPCPVDIAIELPDGTKVLMGLEGRRIELQERVLGGVERVFPGCIAELR